ncbi:VWA domain-containing protein [Streptomyces bobili]|uniref:VWA domain-containing protein n=1 Tax=Streptomyces bobili TaxID=67280 RepID=UPI00378D3CD0
MGILTLLRNAFGRSRKERTAEAEGAARIPSQTEPTNHPEPQPTTTTPETVVPTPPTTAHVPEPRTAAEEEHELVAAAFDKITVPNPTPEQNPTPAPTTAEKPAATEEPAAAEEPATPAAETAAPEVEEPVAEEPAPKVEEPVAAEPTVVEPAPVEEPVAEEPAEAVTEPVAEEPAAVQEPEAEAGAEVEAEAEEPTPEAEVAPEAEAPTAETEVAEAEATEPEATPAAEAEAADGEDAPQGPPAVDDESRTGGAGGNTPAEGEAEAEAPSDPAEPHAEAEALTPAEPHAEAEAPTPAEPATDNTPQPTESADTPPHLLTAHKAAAATLTKLNLTDAAPTDVYLVLDRSASMRAYYKDGSVQALADQTLALAAHLTKTQPPTIHVVFFSTELDGTADLTFTDPENKIDDLHAGLGRMGRTSYHVAVEAVVAHHEKHAASAQSPALVVFQTDGAPDAKTPATQALTAAAANHPTLFFSFVAFGEHENKAFDYLRKLKTGNTAFFHAGPTPRELTDQELYEGVLATWRP